ncbi:Y+L amino acid transporter 2-like [Amphiura filiformis]|uniref:Y+L amino acid transporter 2-like n=1 Tax=Amphiura filiformis TaxID=82378 RepID=UPI003B211027
MALLLEANERRQDTSGIQYSGRDSDADGSQSSAVRLKPTLNVFSGAAINIGTVIGSGIFISPKGVLAGAGSVGLTLLVWVFCGIVSLFGALCFSELGTMIPQSGGPYTYIRVIYGDFPAFMVMWISMIMLQPGTFAILALTFGNYCLQPLFSDLSCPVPYNAVQLLAISAIILLAIINAWSVEWATRVQDIFSFFKVVALGIIIIGGAVEMGQGNVDNFKNAFEGSNIRGLGEAFYSGLYAYAGWGSLNMIAEELKNPYKNLPRAINLSMWTVVVIYVLTNVAYFAALTPAEILASDAVAVTFAAKVLGNFAWIVPTAVVLSTFGSINGKLLTISRLFYVGAREGHLPDVLSMLNIQRSTPLPSLVATVSVSILYCFAKDVYTLINYFSFVSWTMSAFAVIGLVYLRWKEPDASRPYKTNLFIAIFFILSCFFLVIMGAIAAPIDTLIGLAIVSTGIPVYFIVVRPVKKIEWIYKGSDALTVWIQNFLMVVKEEMEDSKDKSK